MNDFGYLKAQGWFKDAAGNWTHPSRRRQSRDRDEGKSAKLERVNGNALAKPPQVEEKDSGKFIVRVVSFRRTLLDEDNLAAKFHVDALRYSSILHGDAPGQATIQVSQVKVETEEEEHTRIVITPL